MYWIKHEFIEILFENDAFFSAQFAKKQMTDFLT